MLKLAIIATGGQMVIPGRDMVAPPDLITDQSFKSRLNDYILRADYMPAARPEAGILKRPSIIEVFEKGVTLEDIFDLARTKTGVALYDVLGLCLVLEAEIEFLFANIPEKGNKLIALKEHRKKSKNSEILISPSLCWFELNNDEKKINAIVFNYSHLTQELFKPGSRLIFFHD
ncbi:MAG: hypothetical protein MUD00_01130 [Candidatus Pacebacteria bacterium]|jgi:hypothetical protein|nr:hypothetical protein [Candidatus Paceibacterota bacterium]